MWGKIKPGQRAITEDDAIVIFDVPDWVRLPDALGGTRVRVLSAHNGPCPCGKHETRILVLDEPTGIRVAECPTHGFMWFRNKTK